LVLSFKFFLFPKDILPPIFRYNEKQQERQDKKQAIERMPVSTLIVSEFDLNVNARTSIGTVSLLVKLIFRFCG
jgi:hypothetical protein